MLAGGEGGRIIGENETAGSNSLLQNTRCLGCWSWPNYAALQENVPVQVSGLYVAEKLLIFHNIRKQAPA